MKTASNIEFARDQARDFMEAVRPNEHGIVRLGYHAVEVTNPTHRVPFLNGNPFESLMKALWLLSGRNDVGFMHEYNPSVVGASADGHIIDSALGERIGSRYGFDQVASVINKLRTNSQSDRAVIGTWDPDTDGLDCRSVPRVLSLVFSARHGSLNMTVFARTWNVLDETDTVSFLQEFIAAQLGLPIGSTFYVTPDAWSYIISIERWKSSNYHFPGGKTIPLVEPGLEGRTSFLPDLRRFMDDIEGTAIYRNPFFTEVAEPMRQSWRNTDPVKFLEDEADGTIGWIIAAKNWLLRSDG